MNKILNQVVPTSIGNSKVLNDVDNIPERYRSAFFLFPTKSFVYRHLAERNFFLIKVQPQGLVFRNTDSFKGDPGESYNDLNLLYNQKKGSCGLYTGIYRKICTNGLWAWDHKKSFAQFRKVLFNKIQPDEFDKGLIKITKYINQSVAKYVNVETTEASKNYFLETYLDELSNDSRLVSNYKKFTHMDPKVLLKTINDGGHQWLKPKHNEDKDNNLWLNFNTIQENMTQSILGIGGNKLLPQTNKTLTKTLELVYVNR